MSVVLKRASYGDWEMVRTVMKRTWGIGVGISALGAYDTSCVVHADIIQYRVNEYSFKGVYIVENNASCSRLVASLYGVPASKFNSLSNRYAIEGNYVSFFNKERS